MQTNLLCWQTISGDAKSLPAGEKVAEKCDWPSVSDRQGSFPMALHRLAGGTESETTADNRIAAEVLPRQFVQTCESGHGLRQKSEPVNQTIDVEQVLPEDQGPTETATIVGIVSLSVGESVTAALEGVATPEAGVFQPETSAQVPSASTAVETLAVLSSQREFSQGESHSYDVNTETAKSDPTALGIQAGAPPAAGLADSDSPNVHLSTLASTVSGETQRRDQPPPMQIVVAPPPSQGIKPVSEPLVAGEPDEPQPQPGTERSRSSRGTATRQVEIPAAAGERPVDFNESLADKDSAGKDKDARKSYFPADRALSSADRAASENPESKSEKGIPDLHLRQQEAATNDSRVSLPAGDSQTLTEEQAKVERPNPTQIIDQIVKKAVIRLKDGYSEVRIDLKPELLGPLRMQILTENQQVTLRILTENPLVKEIIENSIAQLKADLLSQGLQMEELEVSLNGDHARFGHHPDNTDQSEWGSRKSPRGAAEVAKDASGAATSPALATANGRSIDTFV